MEYSSNDDLNDFKKTKTYSHGIENICFMLYRKYILFEESKNSTQKEEYVYLHKKDNEMKNDRITVENEGIVEYSNDFKNCKITHCIQ